VIASPTTEQILLECSRELLEGILPAIDDELLKVRVAMLEHVVRNAATRSGHEVAWMISESQAAIAYVESVLAALDPPGLRKALDDIGPVPPDSLHLDDVARTYDRASGALGKAIESAMTAGADTLIQRGVSLLEERLQREMDITGGWGPAGR
jgi:hypothetical protein